MPRFLSPEWLASLDDAARTGPRLHALADERLVVEQCVHDADADDVVWQVVIDDGRVRVRAGRTWRADVVLVTDRATLRSLHTGATNAEQAIAAGRLVVRAGASEIRRHAAALASLDDRFGPVHAETTYEGLP